VDARSLRQSAYARRAERAWRDSWCSACEQRSMSATRKEPPWKWRCIMVPISSGLLGLFDPDATAHTPPMNYCIRVNHSENGEFVLPIDVNNLNPQERTMENLLLPSSPPNVTLPPPDIACRNVPRPRLHIRDGKARPNRHEADPSPSAQGRAIVLNKTNATTIFRWPTATNDALGSSMTSSFFMAWVDYRAAGVESAQGAASQRKATAPTFESATHHITTGPSEARCSRRLPTGAPAAARGRPQTVDDGDLPFFED